MTEASLTMSRRAPSVKRIPIKSGDRIGRLTALDCTKIINPNGHTVRVWVCRCDCGKEKSVRELHLRSAATKSCGCLISDVSKERLTKHGAASGVRPAEYVVWQGMIRRCETPTHKSYAEYGGIGVKVCERWRHDFLAFLEDMGPRPAPTCSLDRYPDNNGDYEPGNVRWATAVEQAENRTHTIWIEFQGARLPLARVAEILGRPYMTIYKRYRKGQPLTG